MINQIRVLHVDDDPSLLDLTADFLEREDDRFALETATTANEALEMLSSRPPDCIISDYDMPGTDGIELLNTVRETHPDLPFILFTGRGSEQVASDAMAAGVTDYLQKGGGTEQYELLANRIENAVQAKRETERADRQEQLMRLTEFAGDTGGFELDREGDTVLLTAGIRRIIGRPDQHELSLQETMELFHPDDREDIQETLDKAFETGEEMHNVWRLQTDYGDERLLDTTITPVAENGEVTTLRGIGHDITDYRDRQRELRRSERRLNALLEYSTDRTSIMNADGHYMYLSPSSETLVGHDPAELTGEEAFEYIHPEDRAKARETFQQILDDPDGVYGVEYRYRDAEGSWRWMEARGTNRLDDPAIEGVVINSRDITERKERERQLNRERERYTTLFEALPNPVLHARAEDGEPIVETVNPAFEDTFGYDAEAIRDEAIYEYILPDDQNDATHQLNRRILSEGEVRTEVERETTDGVRTFRLNVRTKRAEDGGDEGYAVYTDVSEQKAQNEHLEEFTSVVSHDLRNPLTVAEGRLELAQESCESPHLAQAADAIDRSQALIEDLLTLAREGDDVSGVEPVALADVAESSWQTVETAQATLQTHVTETLQADQSRLTQLFENLYRNAVEHGGDDVTVSVGEMDDGFYVADTGPGVPEGDREEIFEAGYSTNDEGTGFGLRIVKQIIEAHGWDIRVTDSDDGGARFGITGVDTSE